eukprot:9496250-Pyramimonas_sp.AAC.2
MMRRSLSRTFSEILGAPATTRSAASTRSTAEISSCLRRAASSAASFTRFASWAPVRPTVAAAICATSTSGAHLLPSRYICRMASRPTRSGGGTATLRSSRPGRISAGSITCETYT